MNPFYGSPRPARSQGFVLGTLAAAVVVSAGIGFIIAASQTLTPQPVGSPGLWTYLIGFSLVVAAAVGVIASLAYHWFVLRGSGRSPLLYIGAILGLTWFTVFVGIALVAYPRAVVSARASVAEEVRVYLRGTLERQERSRLQFLALDLGTILTPGGMATAEGRAASRRKVAQARELIAAQATDMLDAQMRMQGRLSAVAPALLPAFQARSDQGRADVAAGVRLELASLDEIAAIIDLLEATEGRWDIEGGRLRLYDEELTAAYNARAARITELARQEATYNAAITARTEAIRRAIASPDPMSVFTDATPPAAAAPAPAR